jgi:HEPN domain-containing protein
LRDLALIRLKEARVLLRTRNYDGAYYLSGYVVECALKACIAKHTRRSEFPDKKTAVASHTHRLEDLIGVARLSEEFLKEVRANLAFETNWNVAKDWSEHSRYERHSSENAQNMFSAVSDKKHGVFKWIRQHW